MASSCVYVYLHGFLGGITYGIGLTLKEKLKRHGINLTLLDWKAGSGFEGSSVTLGLVQLERFYQKHRKPMKVVGFSMGGLISSVYAAKHPERVSCSVLINPAFNLEDNWYEILKTLKPNACPQLTMQKWEADKKITFGDETTPLTATFSYSYMTDSTSYANFPFLTHPVILFTGKEDVFIPSKTHYLWKMKQQNPDNIEIIEIDDTHEMKLDITLETISKAIVERSR